METSLRLRGGGGLRIHAKEKLPLGYNSLLQAHGEVDTTTIRGPGAAPSYLAVFVRHFYSQLSANIGVGVQVHDTREFTYNLRAKKAIPLSSNGFLGMNLKARLLADKDFKPVSALLIFPKQIHTYIHFSKSHLLCIVQRNVTGAIELAWTILDFRKGQDVRLKLGYELQHKVPYFQLRENNWTLNAYMDGKWDVRFDM